MSLFQDLKLKRRKTSSVLEETSRSTAAAASSYVPASSADSPNSSNNSNSPTLLNQLLRAHSPEKATTPASVAGGNLVFATGSNVIVSNTKRAVDAKKATTLNGQTCAVITCSGSAGKTPTGKLTNNGKSVIQQYRSNSFSSNSSLSPSSSPPTALLSGAQSIAPSAPFHVTSATSKLTHPTKLVNSNGHFTHGILQHSQSINSSGNSSPPSASSSSCSPPPSTSSAVSLFEIDSDQCLDLSSNTLTTCSSTLTPSGHSKPQTIITKPFIAHQTIIKLQPSQELKCSNSEHNYQLQQTAKNRCTIASSSEQQMLLINAGSANSSALSDLNSPKTASSSSGGPLSTLNSGHHPNSLQNSFRPAKGQTFMLATEHIPSTFNQLSHSTNTVTNSTSLVGKTAAGTNGSPKTMLWTLVNPSGSLVNANILFATIPNSAATGNANKPENTKLTATSQSGQIVQCIKPTTLTSTVSKPITNAILTSAPVLKYTFVAPSANLNSANDENESKTNAPNSATSCIASTNASNAYSLSSVIKNGSVESFSDDTSKPFKSNGNLKIDTPTNGGQIAREPLQPHGFQLNAAPPSPPRSPSNDDEQKICFICEDKATGLHYGIITCEGCKGFFKRTVQNKRVYSCVAEGQCVITKQQRNRCQYCRFQKCLRQGMVLAAVREDRMPGGRNSGAVYNLYKVKYKKHKKNNQTSQDKANNGSQSIKSILNDHLLNKDGQPEGGKKMRKNAGSRKKNSSQTNSNHQSNPVNELICSQLNNAGSVFTSEPSTMDTLNSEHTLNTHNSICDSNASLKAEAGELADKPTVGQQPVIMSSILKSALIGKRTYAQPVRLDESVVLADTTVTEDEEKPADLGQESRMRKKEIDELIRQLIQVDDYYTNCGRFINAKAAGESGPNENRKLIQYVRKPADDPQLPDNGQPTDKAVEDLNELIQEQEDEPNTASNELSAAEEDKEDEMLSIIVDKQRSLNDKLCSIGDSIVFRLVQWTKKLPFYSRLPVYSITMLLTHKWHSLLVLTTCAYQVLRGDDQFTSSTNCDRNSELDENGDHQLQQQTEHNMNTLIRCLEQMMQMSKEDEDKEETFLNTRQLEQEAGPLVQALAKVNCYLRSIEITLQEYVLLKIVIMSSDEKEVNNNCKDKELAGLREENGDEDVIQSIHEQHLQALQLITEPHRYERILNSMKVIDEAASILIKSKLFWVPYLLTTNLQ